MSTSNKKIVILKAASRIISKEGFSKLTLEAVCKGAEISKGGLLYHFSNKERIIEGLNYHVLENMKQLINEEEKHSSTFTEAYLKATIKSLEVSDEDLKIFPGLIASLSSKGELMTEWKHTYTDIQNKLEADGVKKEYAHLVRLVGDGLWFGQMFDLAPLETDEVLSLSTYLLHLLEKGNE